MYDGRGCVVMGGECVVMGGGVYSGLCTHLDLLRQPMLDPGWRSHCGHLQHLGGEGEQLAYLGQTGGLGGSKVTLRGRGGEWRGVYYGTVHRNHYVTQKLVTVIIDYGIDLP